jgi:hypothetical protein
MHHAQQLNKPIIFRFASDAVFLTLYTKGTFPVIPQMIKYPGKYCTQFLAWQRRLFIFVLAKSESTGQALFTVSLIC